MVSTEVIEKDTAKFSDLFSTSAASSKKSSVSRSMTRKLAGPKILGMPANPDFTLHFALQDEIGWERRLPLRRRRSDAQTSEEGTADIMN